MQKGEIILSKLLKWAFIYYQYAISQIKRYPHIKVLFSNKDAWKKGLNDAFRFTPYYIKFADFKNENLSDFDLIVPLTINDLIYLAGVRDLTKSNLIPVPSLESIMICDDKYKFNTTLIENGFERYIPKMGNDQIFPFILKKRTDEWGQNSYIITSPGQQDSLLNLINDPGYFCQELVQGQYEYATHILFIKGKIISSINIEFKFDSDAPIKGKDDEIFSRITSNKFLNIFSDILNHIAFEGLCCVNYKIVNDYPKILEINPRFGGSLCQYFALVLHSAVKERFGHGSRAAYFGL